MRSNSVPTWSVVPHPSSATLANFAVFHVLVGTATVLLNGVSGYLIVFKSAKASGDFRKYLLSTVVGFPFSLPFL